MKAKINSLFPFNKTEKFLQFLLIIISIVAGNHSAFGVSAFPWPVEITQPDGTKITVLLKGDEHLQWAQTSDGYSIMRNKRGIYEYSRQNAGMDMVPSGFQARNERERGNSELQFLRNTPKGLRFSNSQYGRMKSITQMVQKSRLKSGSQSGTKKFVCILIGFTDLAFTKTKEDFENLLNQSGYATDGASGSVYDYYKENSYKQLAISVTVAGPYTAAHDMAYYGANDENGHDVNSQELVNEALILADGSVDYADFDNDRDGTVDGVYIIHAGYGEEAGAPAENIWAHNSAIPALVLDGKTISNYSCSSELRGLRGEGITRIGVICHEFGHVMGAPDFYDTNFATDGYNEGTGYWDLMGKGSWNNNGATPAHHNPYTKIFVFGWATSKTLVPGSTVTLNDAENYSNSFYLIKTKTSNEFFLCENRQKHNFDSYIPGHGMLIYHVDGDFIRTAGSEINAGSRQGMYPVCANSTGLPPTTYGVINGSGLPFPGSGNVTSFTDATIPGTLSWASEQSNVPINGITENLVDKTVSFSTNLLSGNPFPPSVRPATNILQTSFSTNWDLSANATGYFLDISDNDQFTALLSGWNNKDVGNVSTFLVSALNPDTEYFYRIRAYNTEGLSDNSNKIALKTAAGQKDASFGLSATSCSEIVTLKWTKSSDPNFLRYRIYAGLANDPVVKIDSTSTNSNDTIAIVPGLTIGMTYNFQVAAVKDDGSEIALSNQFAILLKSAEIPVVRVKSGNELFCSSPSDSIASYQWFKGNKIIPSAVQQSIVTNTSPGAYKVATIDRCGCLNSSATTTILGLPFLTIYPNPVRVSFSLQLNDAVLDETVVSIINSAGVKVMEFRTDKTNSELLKDISVDNLTAGLYVVRALSNQKESYSTKMMVVK